MKYLTDRTEIAMAINFDKYPVLYLNRENRPFAKDMPESDYAVGCRVRVAWDSKESRYEGMTTHGNLYIEDGRLAINREGSMLTASFGYHDVIKMQAEARNAVIVHRGQEVVVVEDWPSKKTCTVRMMKVSDRIDIHCSTVAHLEDLA